MRQKALILGDITMQNRDTARHETRENLGLGIGDLIDTFEIFEMDGSNGRDDRNMRPHHRRPGAVISPLWFMPISKTPNLVLFGIRAKESGTPQ